MVEEATIVSMHIMRSDGHDIQALVDMVSSKQRSTCKRKGHDKEHCLSKKKLDENKYTKRSSAFLDFSLEIPFLLIKIRLRISLMITFP